MKTAFFLPALQRKQAIIALKEALAATSADVEHELATPDDDETFNGEWSQELDEALGYLHDVSTKHERKTVLRILRAFNPAIEVTDDGDLGQEFEKTILAMLVIDLHLDPEKKKNAINAVLGFLLSQNFIDSKLMVILKNSANWNETINLNFQNWLNNCRSLNDQKSAEVINAFIRAVKDFDPALEEKGEWGLECERLLDALSAD